MPILWKEEMSVGIEVIDNEHKYLFCLVNSVELALKLDDGQKLMQMFLDQLLDYTKQHFRHEEQIQRKMGYPLAKQHHEEHQEILNQLLELKKHLQESPAETSKSVDLSSEDDDLSVEDYDPYASPETDTETDTETQDVNLEEIVQLLRSWVLDHVMVSDMKMKTHLKKVIKEKRK
ncbi:MAG: bacteriohemerythrin [Motiliproteus sp.]|nr:bacteriohemerythrin [Motiliproteus sp.]MCW9054260.1 bacteriohemerythrin [Motiliproteus sp.]